MTTDSRSLFDTLTKPTTTNEKRLITALKTVKEYYENWEIDDLSFILSEHKIAVALWNVQHESVLKYTLHNEPLLHGL